MNEPTAVTVRLKNPQEALALYGENDATLRRIRELTPARLSARGDTLTISGDPSDVVKAEIFVRDLLTLIRQGGQIDDVLEQSAALSSGGKMLSSETATSSDLIGLPNKLRPKTPAQREYLEAIQKNEMVFGIGPAGTGKSYLAVAMAVAWLKARKVKRILLTRPAVEAGERLGFLPGDLQAKIDPYLRPLYDALHDMLDTEKFESYMASGTIEIAPLAFMRGRAQPLSSKVLTPLGWREMGTLEVGDHVIGSDGTPTRVMGVYPQGQKDTYQISFTDGTHTLCCEEHLWNVKTASDKRRGKPWRILETREMMGQEKSAHQNRFEIPMLSSPVEFPARVVPMDPYALGLLLGDGCITCTTTPAFSSMDPELVMALESVLEDIELVHKSGVDYTLRHIKGGRGGLRVANPVTKVVRELGLDGKTSNSKFVPDVYKFNAPDVRLAILQGLLDTDGGPVTQSGRTCRIQYASTSKQLAADVIFLVQSLGGVAHGHTRAAEGRRPGFANGRDVPYRNDAEILDIRLPEGMAPFRLERKATKYAEHGAGRPMRYIEKIEKVGREAMQCIQVAAEDALYITDDFIVTHNTLNDSFIILDEAQNTTPEQMKMFLTRMGFSSKVVVTGDVTQVDLPRNITSGLRMAERTLSNIEGIHFHHFSDADVVRHPLVGRIVRAYDQAEADYERDKLERQQERDGRELREREKVV